MVPLPPELIEAIIDAVAESCPESLPDCILVSHQWSPRSNHHLHRAFVTPTITTVDKLQAFTDLVRKHSSLGALATFLKVVPDPGLSLASTYIPFHRLSSGLLPNLRHLALGDTLRWVDYPLAYRKCIAGFFTQVDTLDLSCAFRSVSELFLLVRSFENVRNVRLIYPHHVPPQWMSDQPRFPWRCKTPSRGEFKLQNLELPLAILKSILDVCGDSVVNLSVVFPQMSTLFVDTVERNYLPVECAFASLQRVKVTVPVETDDPTNHTGLAKLQDVFLALFTKPGILYSLSLVQCQEHYTLGYRVDDVSVVRLQRIMKTLVEWNFPMEECETCWKRDKVDMEAPPLRPGYVAFVLPQAKLQTIFGDAAHTQRGCSPALHSRHSDLATCRHDLELDHKHACIRLRPSQLFMLRGTQFDPETIQSGMKYLRLQHGEAVGQMNHSRMALPKDKSHGTRREL